MATLTDRKFAMHIAFWRALRAWAKTGNKIAERMIVSPPQVPTMPKTSNHPSGMRRLGGRVNPSTGADMRGGGIEDILSPFQPIET